MPSTRPMQCVTHPRRHLPNARGYRLLLTSTIVWTLLYVFGIRLLLRSQLLILNMPCSPILYPKRLCTCTASPMVNGILRCSTEGADLFPRPTAHCALMYCGVCRLILHCVAPVRWSRPYQKYTHRTGGRTNPVAMLTERTVPVVTCVKGGSLTYTYLLPLSPPYLSGRPGRLLARISIIVCKAYALKGYYPTRWRKSWEP